MKEAQEPSWLKIKCPSCGAEVGDPCVNMVTDKIKVAPHATRYAATSEGKK